MTLTYKQNMQQFEAVTLYRLLVFVHQKYAAFIEGINTHTHTHTHTKLIVLWKWRHLTAFKY